MGEGAPIDQAPARVQHTPGAMFNADAIDVLTVLRTNNSELAMTLPPFCITGGSYTTI
jgi:hypothetical protein